MRKIFFCVLIFAAGVMQAKDYGLTSPDGRTVVTVNTDGNLSWQVRRDGVEVISPSEMSLELSDGTVFGTMPKVRSVKKGNVDATFPTPIYRKSEVRDCYNYLLFQMNGGYGIEFRAYDSGVAYRFISSRKGRITVKNENAAFNFGGDCKAWIPYVNDNRDGERYCYSFESYYTESALSEMFADSLSTVPLLVDLGSGKKAAVMDAGTEDYPGMFLKRSADGNGLVSEFAPFPSETRVVKCNLVPSKRENFIAVCDGNRTFPWRVVAISDRDADLMDCDLMQCLSPECRIADISWIRPGKTSWDWWSGNHVTGVDFMVGMNTETFRYYVDFSAANGLEYVLVDAGWRGRTLLETRKDFDLEDIVKYGESKGVGIVLWALWAEIVEQAETVFAHYSKLGVKGFKVDFIDSDDQPTVSAMYQMARLAAENHLVIDFHGMKATGLQRAYPNVLNFEGVKGLENSRWCDVVDDVPVDDIPRYDVTAPFARMMLGPMDYTPGAMDNAILCAYRPVEANPMSMGTRAHQMAMYTVFEAPFQMLSDSPSKYMREQECTDFISKVPTVFDRTVALDGEVGEYVVMARQKDGVWYVGAMTNWTPRDIEIDLNFLGEGDWSADIFADGINADRTAEDYRHTVRNVTSSEKLTVHLAPGGGWTARIISK